MPDARNCRKCGRLFNYLGGPPVCTACKEQDEDDFKRVREYLYQNPGATMSEVSSVLDVSTEKIRRYLKEGRLEITNEDGNFILECEKCGKSIRTGRLCEVCEVVVINEIRFAAKKMNTDLLSDDEKKAIGMRYLNKEDKKQ